MTNQSNNLDNGKYGFLKPETKELSHRLVDQLQAKLDDDDNAQHKQYWVALAGGPGSGKTTIAEYIADQLNNKMLGGDEEVAIVLPMDGWHTPQKELRQQYDDDKGMKRRGAPWTFDVELCVEDLKEAKKNGEASLPTYSREISDPVPDGIQLRQSHKIVLVEGIYVIWKDDPRWGALWDLWDERWFVQCPSQEDQVERLISRAMKTWSESKTKLWGEGREGARNKAEFNDVQNMKIVAHCSDYADEVIINY